MLESPVIWDAMKFMWRDRYNSNASNGKCNNGGDYDHLITHLSMH